jgi:hypothetical protein
VVEIHGRVRQGHGRLLDQADWAVEARLKKPRPQKRPRQRPRGEALRQSNRYLAASDCQIQPPRSTESEDYLSPRHTRT